MPAQEYENDEEDVLALPYINVKYQFEPRDWNRILNDQSNIINARRKVALLKRQIAKDKKRTMSMLGLGNNLLIKSKAKLFQKALSDVAGFKKNLDELPEISHATDAQYDIDTSDIVDVDQPYYYEILANQYMG
ncbi:hypothetical protein BdWA1_000697 [Babesia duncani]|uniref:Uncharacterized protein n=1 Tax=Babesia duncani TaxID=323732 RepID=A0AAD9UQ85_9APIC|nr:hypothetical protein BdWA1_000697 [Babesia duncani]